MYTAKSYPDTTVETCNDGQDWRPGKQLQNYQSKQDNGSDAGEKRWAYLLLNR